MTTLNRNTQLLRTLDSFNNHGYNSEIEVIIVDDGSEIPISIKSEKYNFTIKLITLNQPDKWYVNPCIPFNIGLKEAQGEVVIIQNAECFHHGNIVDFVKKNMAILDYSYFSFACYSIDKITSKSNKLEKFSRFNNAIPDLDGANGWYNHSHIRPTGYHFCSAIKKSNLEEIGFFDEAYSDGIGYDDDEFLYRVKNKLKLKIIDDYFVLHQWHYSGTKHDEKLKMKNKLLFVFYTKLRIPAFVVKYFLSPIYTLRIRS